MLYDADRGGEYFKVTSAILYVRRCLAKTYLCRVLWSIYRPRGNKSRSIGAKLSNTAAGSPRLIYHDCDVLPFHISTVHRLLCLNRILFVPKLHQARVRPKMSMRARGRERSVRTEDVVQLGVGVSKWQMLHESWLCRWWREGRWWVRGRVW